ncbi:MAG: UvrD-helicase domain-containing protein, partial [Ruminococcus sp.]|nr:UvrD-helicase domain-containing protein [Ruminococcus sp.]
MSRQWTDNQRLAIEARGGSLLVSAAAGSGKTAVLVERVTQMVSDAENPIPIERLLIVTYTRAAAAELKERISKTLGELIKKDPKNKWYRRQLVYLPRANISTVDSFCGEVVKEFFQKLNVPRDYRLLDSGELTLFVEEAMERTLEHFYCEGSKDFFSLVETFATPKDDKKLQQSIYRLYEFLRSHPFADRWLSEKQRYYTQFTNITDSVWGRVILDYAESAIDYCIDQTNASLNTAEEEPELFSLVSALFLSDLQYLDTLKEKVRNDSWNNISSFADSFNAGRLAPKGYTNHPIKEQISNNRNGVKKIIKKLQELFARDEEETVQEVHSQSGTVVKMFDCVKTFGEYFSKAKISKNTADFSDVMHWTLDLLVTCDGEGNVTKTDVADMLSSRFDAVMVDEFQDANEVQDLIFNAVSDGGKNLFVVGDVKQSIYRFRQAMPEIFLGRKNVLPLYSSEIDSYPAKVILECNFRSRKEVTEFVNFVFTTVMSERIGDMEYTKEEHLVAAASYPAADTPCNELHLLDLEDNDDIDSAVAEARYIASVIYDKCSNTYIKDGDTQRLLRFGDIAILMRSKSTYGDVYARELRKLGIPVSVETDSGFLQSPEIRVAMDFLRVVDNPLQDIPLLTMLMSPVYGFTPDDMAIMRADSRKLPLYMSLKVYAEKGNAKAQNFLSELETLRTLAVTMPSDTFISTLYERTDMLSIARATGGVSAVDNLRLLCEYANAYEQGASKGVSAFVNYIDRLIENKKDLSPATVQGTDNENVVRIMT